MRVALCALCCTLALAACTQHVPTQPVATPIGATQATLHTFVQAHEYSGTLVASRTVTVGANASGRLASVPVRVGDTVEAGETLATIDASAYTAALSQASGAHSAALAERVAAQAALVQAQARERLAAVTAQRAATLYGSGDVSRQNYDETQAALQTARAAVAQANASLSSAAGTVAESAASIEAAAVPVRETTIRAPFSGIITEKLIERGAVVNPGSPLLSMEDNRSLEAEIAVPEDLAARLNPGAPVRVAVDAIAASVEGHIRAIIPSPNAQLHTATVRVAVADHAGLLRGMFVRVRLATQPRMLIAIPSEALVTRAGQSGVFAIHGGRAEFIPVEAGDSSEGWIAVTGIARGTMVAMRGVEQLDDGSAVLVR